MDLSQLNPLNVATFAMSAMALLFSTLALFPFLRNMLAIFRDAVLWIALLFVLGGGGFIGWNYFQQEQRRQPPTAQATQVVNQPPSSPGFTFEARGNP